MNHIYKYALDGVGKETKITVKGYPSVLHFAYISEQFYIWVELMDFDGEYGEEELTFTIVGTGWDYEGEALKTCIVGDFVWHLICKHEYA